MGRPLTYFHEPFLEAFDPDLRKELGVWYTPPEIVRYQVRKVDQLLRRELGCARGFGDPRVVVLDPCCGTAAYLHRSHSAARRPSMIALDTRSLAAYWVSREATVVEELGARP
jgi:predicted helicase